jgi:hypothetical protein
MRDEGVVYPNGQAGGRRRKGRKAGRKSRKNCKANRKSRKNRKASRKNRKANRKSRKQRQGGGGCLADTAGEFSKSGDGMLLKDYSGAGLHPEWKSVESTNGGDYLSPTL